MSLLTWKRRAEGVTHEDQTFEKMDLRSMKGFGSTFRNCTFLECNLDISDLRSCRFETVEFRKCSVRLVNMATSFLQDVIFDGCDMEGSSLMGCELRLVQFRECRMAYADTLFQDATVRGATAFSGCELRGSNLDFRQVDPGSLAFYDSNLWGAKISFGCAFWSGYIDENLTKQALALIARASRDPRVVELAGDQYAVVCRAMDGDKACTRASTTSAETGSNQTRNSPVPMEQTAIAATEETRATPMMIEGI